MELTNDQKVGLGILGVLGVGAAVLASQSNQEPPPSNHEPIAPPPQRIRPDLLQPIRPNTPTTLAPVVPIFPSTAPTTPPRGILSPDADEQAFFARWGRYRTTNASTLLADMQAGRRDALTMPLTLEQKRNTTPLEARALLIYIDSPQSLRGLSDVLLTAMLSSYDPKDLNKVKSPNVSEVFKFFFYHDFVFSDSSAFVQNGLWALNWFTCQSIKRAGGAWGIQANMPTLETPEGWYFSTSCLPKTYGGILGGCAIHKQGTVIPELMRHMKDAQAYLFEYTALRLQNMVYLLSTSKKDGRMQGLLVNSIKALGSVGAGIVGLASGNPAGFIKGLLDLALNFVNFFMVLADSDKINETIQLTVGLFLESVLSVYAFNKPLASMLLGYQLSAISDDPPYQVKNGGRSISPLSRSNCLVREGLPAPFSCAGVNFPQLALFARGFPFGLITWIRAGQAAGIRLRFAPVGPTIDPFYAGKPIGAEIFIVGEGGIDIWRGEMSAPESQTVESFDLGVLKKG